MKIYISSLFQGILIAFIFGIANLANANSNASDELSQIHERIKSKFVTLKHINASELEQMPREDILVFDVREKSEFNVSRIEGAIQVSPDISARKFIRDYGEKVKGKTLVFYCSVGRRSSELANLVQSNLVSSVEVPIFNLQGGIFNWHNESRSLVNGAGETDYIHPYTRYWGKLINRREMIRFKPE